MTTPRRLSRPPITEALIDFRVDGAQAATHDLIEGLAAKLSSEYPQTRGHRSSETSLEVREGRGPATIARELDSEGAVLVSCDDKLIAQFRPAGFTLNRLRPYTSWEEIYPEALRLWEEYLAVFQPKRVMRVAVRYINHVHLPAGELHLADYLSAPISVPHDLPAKMTSFLNSVVLYDKATGCSARVTQSLEPKSPSGSVLLLDIDAYRAGDWSVGDDSIRSTLESLRVLKNSAFFGCLTPKTLAGFE